MLLDQGKAAVYRRYPFTIILKVAIEAPQTEPLRIKIDPGSKTTGMVVVNDATGEVVFAANLEHRGDKVKKRLDDRSAMRRCRRNHHTRYRAPRFDNRERPKGWLPPSLESRIANIMTWVNRLRRYCPITAISQELVKFDLQQMENPEISGVEYQQGTLQGYETREYLLEKWNRQCTYCGKKDIPLQVEHIHPRARGGTDRISNLCLACEPCNVSKGTRDIKEFLANKPDMLKKVLAQAKVPLKDATAVNATRWALYERLQATGLPVECGSGGLTKFNRTTRGLPKDHWIDAACVARSASECINVSGVKPLHILASGHGNRQICQTNDIGLPTQYRQRKKYHFGFQTGDMVRARVTRGKYAGWHVGRVTTKASGQFTMRTPSGKISISHRNCQTLQRHDGYGYAYLAPIVAQKRPSVSLQAVTH
jgi:5-methylcytosine-specific restriction endonuclease McrA